MTLQGVLFSFTSSVVTQSLDSPSSFLLSFLLSSQLSVNKGKGSGKQKPGIRLDSQRKAQNSWRCEDEILKRQTSGKKRGRWRRRPSTELNGRRGCCSLSLSLSLLRDEIDKTRHHGQHQDRKTWEGMLFMFMVFFRKRISFLLCRQSFSQEGIKIMDEKLIIVKEWMSCFPHSSSSFFLFFSCLRVPCLFLWPLSSKEFLSQDTHITVLTCVSVITLKRRLKGMKKGDKMESIEKQGPRQVSKVKRSRTKSKTFFIGIQWRRNTLNILTKRPLSFHDLRLFRERERERKRERDLLLFDEEKGVDSFQEFCPALHSFVFFRKTCIAFLQPLLPFFSSQENLLGFSFTRLAFWPKFITLVSHLLCSLERKFFKKTFDLSSISCIISSCMNDHFCYFKSNRSNRNMAIRDPRNYCWNRFWISQKHHLLSLMSMDLKKVIKNDGLSGQ